MQIRWVFYMCDICGKSFLSLHDLDRHIADAHEEKGGEMATFDNMRKENKTICEYCGAEKQGIGFFIGASKGADWCLVEGTGKMTCPACYPKAQAEAKVIIDRM